PFRRCPASWRNSIVLVFCHTQNGWAPSSKMTSSTKPPSLARWLGWPLGRRRPISFSHRPTWCEVAPNNWPNWVRLSVGNAGNGSLSIGPPHFSFSLTHEFYIQFSSDPLNVGPSENPPVANAELGFWYLSGRNQIDHFVRLGAENL